MPMALLMGVGRAGNASEGSFPLGLLSHSQLSTYNDFDTVLLARVIQEIQPRSLIQLLQGREFIFFF